jgi:hypothetical protein
MLKGIKLVCVVVVLYVVATVIISYIFSGVVREFHPDFTAEMSVEAGMLIEEKQSSFPYIMYYFLSQLLFVFLSYVYIYRKYRLGNIYIYILPVLFFLLEIYFIYKFDGEYPLRYLVSKVLAILLSIFGIYLLNKYQKRPGA